MNELLFLCYIFTVATASIIALRLGKEALISLICIQAILTNLFVTKHITLLGLTATASDGLTIGIMLSLNLLREYYTKEIAQQAIFLSFLGALFYTCISFLTLSYIPAVTDTASAHFTALLTPMPRLVAASLFVSVSVQYLDLILYSFLNKLFHKRFFILRNYLTLTFTQFIDTILFTFVGLYGINESFTKMNTLFDIIITSYSIKLLVILIAVPFIKIANTFSRSTKPS
ncbi:queuosine precursor transporter [Candidatus Dependentiae bacterium]|nr:queuosine precursor transporter [Candidatus Dependentiae bacterium]